MIGVRDWNRVESDRVAWAMITNRVLRCVIVYIAIATADDRSTNWSVFVRYMFATRAVGDWWPQKFSQRRVIVDLVFIQIAIFSPHCGSWYQKPSTAYAMQKLANSRYDFDSWERKQ